ncbi:MAG TPA: aldehyde dehydrogenase family protein [Solirubrobacteraceae bacterium]|nr:aldehyde dehydrogenase family protein [Solirubrobacteraceae bacterium]
MAAIGIPAEAVLDIAALFEDSAHLIGGKWVPARSGQTIEVLNPATGELIAKVPRGDKADVDDAVAAAAAAFPAWRDMNPILRAELLMKWANLMDKYAVEIDLLECMEVGHPSMRPPIAQSIRTAAGAADKVLATTLPTMSDETLGLTLREPFGVTGILIAWNAPGPSLPKRLVGPLVTGNTAVIKPAEDAPLTILLLMKLAHEAGIPAGVVNVVTGYGLEAGEALTRHPGVRKYSFTGSAETGRKVLEAAATHLAPVNLELGGKSPQIVFADADLDRAVPAIVAGIIGNAGQACAAGSRVVVERSVKDELVARLKESFEKVTVGYWFEKVQMGPLVNAKQEQRVLGYIQSGIDEGATLVIGGKKMTGPKWDSGAFIEPTIFDDVRPDMKIAQEEIFGPVLAVLAFDTEAEALEMANGTKYGLVSFLWTKDAGRAVRFSHRVEAGAVFVNTFMGMGALNIPAGGFKSSGYGRISSTESLLEWTQVKAVVIDGRP